MPMPVSKDSLAVYLNDHLAGSVAAIELVTKVRSDNEGTPLGDVLGRLLVDVEEDRASLESLIGRLGVAGSSVKRAGATVVEKLGRLRFHERVTGSGALSRLMEMETLSLGIEGKLGLWKALLEVAPSSPELEATDLTGLADRARRQLDGLEPLRRAAAREALVDP
jgi:hypothetical protein